RGVVRLLHRRIDAAIEDFNSARELRPGASQAYVNLGRSYFDKGDLVKAMQILNEPAATESRSPQVFRLRAYIRHAQSIDSNGIEEVVAELDKALATSSPGSRQYGECHLDKGRLLHTHGRPADALFEYRAAHDVAPQSPEPLALQGIALRQLNRYAEAAEAFDRFFEIQPYSTEVNAALTKSVADRSTTHV